MDRWMNGWCMCVCVCVCMCVCISLCFLTHVRVIRTIFEVALQHLMAVSPVSSTDLRSPLPLPLPLQGGQYSSRVNQEFANGVFRPEGQVVYVDPNSHTEPTKVSTVLEGHGRGKQHQTGLLVVTICVVQLISDCLSHCVITRKQTDQSNLKN